MRTTFALLILTWAATSSVTHTALHAQGAPGDRPRNVLSLEANPFRGTVSYARAVSTKWDLGVNFGFGAPQIDVTLFKRRVDFRDFAHVGAMARRHFGNHMLLELGGRAGFADYHECTASDCWPQLYVGPSAMVAVAGLAANGPTNCIATSIHPNVTCNRRCSSTLHHRRPRFSPSPSSRHRTDRC